MRLARCSRTSWLIAFFFRFERAETQKTIFGLSNQRLDKNRFLCNKKSWPEKTLEQKPKIAFPEHVMFLFFQNIHRNLTFEKKKPMVISVQRIFQEVREEEADHEKNLASGTKPPGMFLKQSECWDKLLWDWLGWLDFWSINSNSIIYLVQENTHKKTIVEHVNKKVSEQPKKHLVTVPFYF